MTIKTPEKKILVGAILPWLVALSALIFYWITLNPWVSLGNVDQVAGIVGLSDIPQLTPSIYLLATYPLHWLPAHLVPVGLNVFSAVCAALSLALLARSVALLPHDRTHDQRLREEGEFSLLSIPGAWVPPVLAALAFGLQLSIWENATNGAREMLDLLLFAYVIRCVLEYRIDERDSWLYLAALVYGAGMTGNWAMIGLLPLFVFAMIWIRGVSFFNLRFLSILAACGFAGLLLYLVSPAVYTHSDFAQATFWQALKSSIKSQKDLLSFIIHNPPANVLLMLAVTSLLPMLLIGIKWPSHFGDPSPLGTALTTGVFHLTHGAFFGICLCATLDAGFSARPTCLQRIPSGLSLLLLLCFLSALSIGYFAGYFLLVFRPLRDRSRRNSKWPKILHWSAQGLVYVLLTLVPLLIWCKNADRFALGKASSLKSFARNLAEKLPENAVVLSDDTMRLYLTELCCGQDGGQHDRIFLNTQSLPAFLGQLVQSPNEFKKRQQLHPEEWLAMNEVTNLLYGVRDQNEVLSRLQLGLLNKLSEKRPLYYLNPSFGVFFEVFYPVPHGLVYELRHYDTNSISAPPLAEGVITENADFWQRAKTEFEYLAPYAYEPRKNPHPGFIQRLWQRFSTKLNIAYEPVLMARMLCSYYSLQQNIWGIELQKANKLSEAQQQFKEAEQSENSIDSQSKNKVARRNLEFNQSLQDKVPPAIQEETGTDSNKSIVKSVSQDFENDPRTAMKILHDFGPFDEPTHRLIQARMFAAGSLPRQSAQQYERITELVPDYLPAKYAIAATYISLQPSKALDLIADLEKQIETSAEPALAKSDLLALKSRALFVDHKPEQAEKLLRERMEKAPNDNNLLNMVFQISVQLGFNTNAMLAVDRLLATKSDDINLLINKGYLAIQMGDFQTAIPALTSALSLETNNPTAKFDRAIAYLGSGKLDEARLDYEDLEKVSPNAFQLYYGLGEIAWRRNDTNSAIRYYDLYLANVTVSNAESNTIRERFQSLRTPAPAATDTPAPKFQ